MSHRRGRSRATRPDGVVLPPAWTPTSPSRLRLLPLASFLLVLGLLAGMLFARAAVAVDEWSCGDSDHDGVCDDWDNCPKVANPDQADTDVDEDGDEDGHGDACDACPGSGSVDSDGDGVCDERDTCNFLPAPQTDTDGDFIGDACDVCPAMPRDGRDTASDRDSDSRPDVCDACPDDPTDACATLLGCTPAGALVRVAPGAEGVSLVGLLGMQCNALARDEGSDTIFMLTWSDKTGYALHVLDPATATSSLVAPLAPDDPEATLLEGMGFAPDGRLMTISRHGQRLLAIDPATAAVTEIGPTGFDDEVDRGIARAGNSLLIADAVQLAELDPATGRARHSVPLSFPVHCRGVDDRDVHALLAAPNGVLVGLMTCNHRQFSYLALFDREIGTVRFAGNNLPKLSGLVLLPGAAIEDCENCVDDDGDGLVDLEDPACCTNATGLPILARRAEARSTQAGLAFDLRATLDTTLLEIPPPPFWSAALQLGDRAGGERWCARVGHQQFGNLDDRTWRRRSGDELRLLKLVRAPGDEQATVVARGRRIGLQPSSALEMRVGLQQGAATLPACYAGPAALR